MSGVGAIFWDVGGVLGTNAWDTSQRRAAAERFGLDWDEFQERHAPLSDALDRGTLSLEDYLDEAVFHRRRAFSRDDFRAHMLAGSRPDPEVLALVDAVGRAGVCFQAVLNNESRELNRHRIAAFGLDRRFSVFFSSCYLGVKKPEPEIYRIALEVSGRQPSDCLFIDDRALNLECAVRFGMRTHHFQGAAPLRAALAELGAI